MKKLGHLLNGLLIVLGLVGLLRPGVGLAHSMLLASVPAAGAKLDSSPSEIKLTFSSVLRPQSSFVLANDNFQFIGGVESTLIAVPGNQLVAQIPTLSPGNYTVYWDIVGEDGDRVSGTFSFVVLGVGGAWLGRSWLWLTLLVVVVGFVYIRFRSKSGRR